MDSMRHLSTSLPPASGRRLRPEQAQDLLSDFKAAALSVTNLYKTAAAAQTKSRTAGYQDALDDLLTFLDSENLGLMDGEGWRVRQWATERLDDNGLQLQQRQPASGDEDEEEQVASKEEEVPRVQREDATRSSSPETTRKHAVTPSDTHEPSSSPRRTRRISSEPPSEAQLSQTEPQTTNTMPSLANFTFSSNTAYPTNHDREDTPTNLDNNGTSMELDSSTTNTSGTPRPQHRASRPRHSRPRGGGGTGTNSINFSLGSGVGSKRKMPYPDFFDISGINFDGPNTNNGNGHDRKDHGGGKNGKRGRFV